MTAEKDNKVYTIDESTKDRYAAEQESSLRASITSLKDEVKKMQFENDRLYVSNNILENCLSTIKHETMYYPATINHATIAVTNQ